MTFSKLLLGAMASDARSIYYSISNAWRNPVRTMANVACSPVGLLLGVTVAGCLGDTKTIAGTSAAWAAARALKNGSLKLGVA
jgi:hypothetical protein